MTSQSILITGATGAVGPSVVSALVHAGYQVTVLARSEPAQGLFPDGVKVVRGEVNDAEVLRLATEGKFAVVHMASKLHVNNPNAREQQEIRRVNVEGTGMVVSAAQRAGVRRLVHVSTIAVYGYSRPRELTEESSLEPTTIYGTTKLEAEGVALAGVTEDAKPLSTVLRLGTVYGPRIKGNYATLLRSLARGRFVPLGPGKNRRTLVHVDDVAQAIRLAVESDDMAGEIYNVTDGQTYELSAIIAEMARALGQHPPKFSVPVTPVKLAARVLDGAARLVGRRSKVATLVDKYLEEVVVDGSKLESVGFRRRYDLAEGWAQTVAELRAAGEL